MVFGFEPNPEAYECLNGNYQIYKGWITSDLVINKKHIDSGRMHIFNIALSNVETIEHMDFYVNSKDCGTSSLYSHDQNDLGPIKKIIKVPVYNLKMFFELFPWDKISYIDYIKVDAQGSDLNILKGAGTYLSERVVYVTAEPDGYQYIGADDCNVSSIVEYMNSIGFICVKHPNTVDPTFLNKNYLHLKDSIYISQK
jgi:FkbM family methyltransferase